MTTFDNLVASLRNVPIRRFIAALEKDGFARRENTRGSHRVYLHPDGRRAVVAVHKASLPMPRKTLSIFLKMTQWNEEDAIALDLLRRPSPRK